jgi:plastocyanin
MKKIVIALVVLLIIAAGAVALTHSSTNTPTQTQSATNSQTSSNSTAPENGNVQMTHMLFTPSQISVRVGGTVTWANNDNTAHTVIDDLSAVGGPHSGDIQPGSSYSFTFNKAGSYQYHCSIHPSMRGTIVVK